MRRVFFASRFEKKLKVFHSRHREFSTATEAAIIAIASDPHAPALKTHRLHGQLADCTAAAAAMKVSPITPQTHHSLSLDNAEIPRTNRNVACDD